MKSEGRSDIHLSSLANIEVTKRCHSIIPMSNAPAREIANQMLAEACFCMGATADSQAGLQTYCTFDLNWQPLNWGSFVLGFCPCNQPRFWSYPRVHPWTLGYDQKRSQLHGQKLRTKLSQFGGGVMRELWLFLGRSVRISSQNGHVNSWTSPIKLWLWYHH